MSRVLVCGRGPLPWRAPERGPVHGRRSWQFARALADAGHSVALLAIVAGDALDADVERDQRDGVAIWAISEHACHERPEVVAAPLEAHRPDALVGVSGEASAILVNHVGDLPLWVDLDGDPMVRAQARAAGGRGDFWVNEAYRKHVPVLMRADRLSVRTAAHRASVVGQLGMVGRLIGENEGYEFVAEMPEVIADDALASLRAIERRLRAPGDPFYLLWSGAFRPWADVDALFEAVEMLLAENERLTFCALGGPDDGADALYARLQRRADQSPFRSRVDLPGWVGRDELRERYARADAGIFVERPSYLGLSARRGRALEWMAAGLPVVCTDLTEIATELEAAGAAHRTPVGRVIALRDAIRRLVDDPEEALTMGLRGRRHVRDARLPAVGLAPLLSWAQAPRRAPAREARVTLDRHPGPLQQHAATMRAHLANGGAAGAVAAVGRFAARRLGQRALRTIDRMAEPPGGEG